MLLKYTYFWFVLMVLAILNGAVREMAYLPYLGEHTAQQVSSFTAAALFFAATWLISKRWRIPDRWSALKIGLIWLLMTIGFEFGFGHYLAGNSWESLLQNYNLFAGRLWIPLLIWVLFIPFAVFHIRNR